MNILTAVRNLTFVGKLFAAAKLDLNAMIDTGDETALAAHIEAASKQSTPAALTAEHPEVAALITAATAQLRSEFETQVSGFKSQVSALTTGATAAGVKIEAAKAGEPTAEEVTAAVNARISIKARELLASHGVTDFLSDTPDSDPEAADKSKTPQLTGTAGLAQIFRAHAKF